MAAPKNSLYHVLLVLAYGYFIALGVIWFAGSAKPQFRFNYFAFAMVAVFVVQIFLRRKLMNLILGILTLFFCIFMLLDVFAAYNVFAKGAHLDATGILLVAVFLTGILFSGILIFSFHVLNKELEV
jgi:hypothetical protein